MKENLKKWIGLLILWIDFEIKLVVVLIIVLDFDRDWINYEWTLIEIDRDWINWWRSGRLRIDFDESWWRIKKIE